MPMKTELASRGSAMTTNRSFYDALWSQTHLAQPECFNTWPLIAGLLPTSPMRLEVGPGLRPRLPLVATHFIDISSSVIQTLKAGGGIAQAGEVTALPYDDGCFDLVCAFDIVEHVEDDARALAELRRVLKEDGLLIFSVPLHAAYWDEFDGLVGHQRRYEPADLMTLLAESNLVLEKSAVFGMQPTNRRLLRCAMWFLTHQRRAALLWYNWVFLPLAILCQRRLKFQDGLLETGGVAEIVMVCRRA